MTMENFLQEFLTSEAFQTLLASAILGALGWIAAEFHRRTGVELSKERRDSLHSAVQTGIASALKDGRIDVNDWHALRAHVLAHIAGGGAPDALQHVPHDDETIDNLIERYRPSAGPTTTTTKQGESL